MAGKSAWDSSGTPNHGMMPPFGVTTSSPGWTGSVSIGTFPPSPRMDLVRKRASLARTLHDRMDRTGDALTSMGFSGACHPLLNLDELDKELSWGLKNPWGTGLTDVLNIRPHVLIPRVPDLARPDALKLYTDRGFTLVGICGDPARKGDVPGDGFFQIIRLLPASPVP